MTDKSRLIQSMTNLIQHISINHKNQQQIFSTLSQTDIKKILANLQDSNQRLRKITLLLLAQLLYENIGLQVRFCQMLAIPQQPGKIVFTNNFPKILLQDPQSIGQIYKILKDETNNKCVQQRGLFWYIDSQSKPKILQIGKRNSTIDPLNCIVGVWILSQINNQKNIQDNKNNSKKGLLNNIGSPKFDFKNIQAGNIGNTKVKLNNSQHIQTNKYLFKLQTPIRSSINQDKQKIRSNSKQLNYNRINFTPTQPRSQIKSYIPLQINKTICMTQRQNTTQINLQLDKLKYIKTNNFIKQNITPINSTSSVNTVNSANNNIGINYHDRVSLYDGLKNNRLNGYHIQKMGEQNYQFQKNL